MPTIITPTPLELELRRFTDLQTASKIARSLKRLYGITTRDGLEYMYHTRRKELCGARNIGEKSCQVIETLVHSQPEVELPEERLEILG